MQIQFRIMSESEQNGSFTFNLGVATRLDRARTTQCYWDSRSLTVQSSPNNCIRAECPHPPERLETRRRGKNFGLTPIDQESENRYH